MDIDVSKHLLSRIKEADSVDNKIHIIELFLEELVKDQIQNELLDEKDGPVIFREHINQTMEKVSELAALTARMGKRETKLANEILALNEMINKLSEKLYNLQKQ